MKYYLTEKEYTHWARPYQMTLLNYIDHVDALNIRMDEAPINVLERDPELKQKIESVLENIESKLEDAYPRDFTIQPLTRGEAFLEDIKLVFNYTYKYFDRAIPFKGIYQSEKERVQELHKEFDFKQNLNEAKAMVDRLLGEKDMKGTSIDTIDIGESTPPEVPLQEGS